ncbi:hypothetical protein ACFVFW_004821, partial [Escherichia coli]
GAGFRNLSLAFLLYAQSKGWLTSAQAGNIMSRFAGYGEHINWNELCKETGKGFLFALGGGCI